MLCVYSPMWSCSPWGKGCELQTWEMRNESQAFWFVNQRWDLRVRQFCWSIFLYICFVLIIFLLKVPGSVSLLQSGNTQTFLFWSVFTFTQCFKRSCSFYLLSPCASLFTCFVSTLQQFVLELCWPTRHSMRRVWLCCSVTSKISSSKF